MNRTVLFLSLIAFAFSTPGLSQEPASGTYYIRSALGRYLDVQWGNPNNGTTMHLWDFNGGAAQKWHIKKEAGGYFTIKSDLGRCLDVPNGRGDMGLLPQLWDCYAGQPQIWVFTRMPDGSWVITSGAGTVLDVQNANPAAGTPVWMYPFNGSVAQLWHLEPVFSPRAALLSPATLNTNPVRGDFSISLLGIAMGECGSDRDCSHEPVAGFVDVSVIGPMDARVPRAGDNGSNTIWESQDYALICYLMPEPPDGGWPRHGDYLDYGSPHPENVRSQTWTFPLQGPAENNAFIDSYTVFLEFNLGNQHKDNDFASTGHHWLAPGGDPLRLNYSLRRVVDGMADNEERMFYVGPLQTPTDRCHEYRLVFKVKLAPR